MRRLLVLRTLADRHGQIDDRAAAQRPNRELPADAIADEQIEQILRRFDRVTVELQQHVADEHAR